MRFAPTADVQIEYRISLDGQTKTSQQGRGKSEENYFQLFFQKVDKLLIYDGCLECIFKSITRNIKNITDKKKCQIRKKIK